MVKTEIKQHCKSGCFWTPRGICWNEILIILSCLRWKGIRKRALGLWPAGGPVRAFWDQKGLNYGAVSPELSPPPPLHMCTPGWRFGFTLCTDTLLALLKTSVSPSVSLAFTRSRVIWFMFVLILLINTLVEQSFQHEFVHVYHCTSDPSWKTKSIKFPCNNCYL